MLFRDRTYAAFLLEERLRKYKGCDGLVLAIPRGGVPIGYQLAHLLHLPLDIILSKKIPHPANEEFAIGSVSGDEVVYDMACAGDTPSDYITHEVKRIQHDNAARYKSFQMGRTPASIAGKIVILTDDGIATGNTLRACIQCIRKQHPEKLIVAVPVASMEAINKLSPMVDEFISLYMPQHFHAVGEFYENFSPVEDEEVKRLLHKADHELATPV